MMGGESGTSTLSRPAAFPLAAPIHVMTISSQPKAFGSWGPNVAEVPHASEAYSTASPAEGDRTFPKREPRACAFRRRRDGRRTPENGKTGPCWTADSRSVTSEAKLDRAVPGAANRRWVRRTVPCRAQPVCRERVAVVWNLAALASSGSTANAWRLEAWCYVCDMVQPATARGYGFWLT